MQVNDSDFQKKAQLFIKTILEKRNMGVYKVAKEVMRLSQREVPHGDTQVLQNSGALQPDMPAEEIIVGYGAIYAAYQHEGGDGKRVIKNWQKGRKGKYLEDPIKNNMTLFLNILGGSLK